MNYILFDDSSRGDLLPLTFIRPVADIRVGILTIREKWEKYLQSKTSSLTEAYLSAKHPLIKASDNILINGSVLPNKELLKHIHALKPNESLVSKDYIIAMHITEKGLQNLESKDTDGHGEGENIELSDIKEVETQVPHIKITYPWDIFSLNAEAIKADYQLITKGRKSKAISKTNSIIGEGEIFIEEGANVEYATLNTKNGPIYIGQGAEIMEGSNIRGPFSLGEHSVIKMSAKIYGGTTVGPYCKVGGELNNVVIFAYSNKAHDGFLGSAVIGEWCNIGADSNNSNLRNTYDEVKMWNYPQQRFIYTGLQFCGLIMGDHSKCGINTMFNTGTVIGVNANIFGAGYQRVFIPSFMWGSNASGYTTYETEKAIKVAELMAARRDIIFTEEDKKILRSVFNLTFAYRKI